jgi:hypothetical protein
MTVQEMPGGDRYADALKCLGHYSSHIMAGVTAIAIPNDLTAGRIIPLTWISAVAWMIWMASIYAEARYHSEHLCERCIAATPLDPGAAVKRWKPALWWKHSKISAAALIIVFIWSLSATVSVIGGWLWYALGAPLLLILAGTIFAMHQHHRLYPWCPWCHWPDEGGEEVVPDVPAPTVHA